MSDRPPKERAGAKFRQSIEFTPLSLDCEKAWAHVCAASAGLRITGRTKNHGRPNMGKSTLKTFTIAIGTAGVLALGLATPTLASGATSAAKKVAGSVEQTDVRGHHHNRVSRD